MKKIVALYALLSAVAAPIIVHAQDAKVEALGLTTGKKLTEAQKDVFMFTHEGTRLQMTIAIPGKTFIGAEREESRFEKFVDDKGTNLFEPLGKEPDTDDWLGSFGPKFTDDGKLCGLTVEAPGLPAKDATRLSFAGDLVLRCGSTPKTVEQKNVAMKKGSKITTGIVPFDIKAIRVVGNETEVDLHAKKSLERIIKIAFFDKTGRALKSRRAGYESSSFFDSYDITETHVITGKPTVANVKITYFDKVEKVTVPVRVDVGLGLKPLAVEKAVE